MMHAATLLLCLSLFGIGYSQNTTTPTASACVDDPGVDCFVYEDSQCVGIYAQWAIKTCPLRCGYCTDGSRLECKDGISYCDELGENVCSKEEFGGYLRKNCRKYCNFCRAPTDYLVSNTTATPVTPVQGSQQTPNQGGNNVVPTAGGSGQVPTKVVNADWCVDDKTIGCWNYDDLKCTGRYEPWARAHCPFRCGYCPGKYPECKDYINYCDEFGDNACNTPLYGGYMRENCRKSCNMCTYPGQNMTPNALPTGSSLPPVVTASTIRPSISHPPTVAGTVKPSRIPVKPNPSLQTLFPILPTGAACKDRLIDCTTYDQESCVGIFKSWAMLNCPNHCGYCRGVDSGCVDFEHCEHLPHDICSNPSYANVAQTSCRKFCGICTDGTTPTPTTEVSTPENGNCSRNFTGVSVPDCCNNLCACDDTISGYVTDASNEKMYLANVSVYIDCHCQHFATTNNFGYYSISGICLENNTLRFELEGYRSQLVDVVLNGTWVANPLMERVPNLNRK